MTVKGRKGDTVVEVDEAPRRDSTLESLAKLPGLAHKEGSHTAGNSPGVNDGAGALVLASDEWAEREGKEVARRDRRPGPGRRRLPVPRPHARQRGDQGAREGRPAAGRHRPVGDQRGVRVGHAELDPDARHRRGPRQRQRRRGRDRPPDRRVRRPHPRHARARAAPARRRLRLRGDLLGRRPGRRRDRAGRDRAPAHPAAAPRGRRAAPARGDGRGVLRPRPHADRGLVGLPVRPRGLQGGDRHAAPARRATRGRTSCSACAARPTPAPTRCASGSARCSRACACATCSGSRPTCSPACCRGCTRRCSTIAYGHQDAGRPIFICTAASQEMAELMAIVLTFDGAVGSVSEVVDGHYTGRAGGPFTYREGKAQAIRELAEREGIDLAASWAYSDSESDLPMLRLVGHPVAVNPDAELGRVARARGLGGAALRAPRPAAARARRRGPRRRAGRARLRRPLAPLGAAAAARERRSRCAADEPARADAPSSARSATSPRASPTSGSRRTPPPGTASTRSRASCSASWASSG